MKLHPTRGKQATKDVLRGRMMTEIITSPSGRRALQECQETLARPANADQISRRFVLSRFATELNIYQYELVDLLKRFAKEAETKKAPTNRA